MNTKLTIVTTADGSNTIFNPLVGENYHSRHGALQESKHVFLAAGLKYFLETKNTQTVSVLEVGFGTGLNFLISADHSTANNISLNYTGIEAYPLTLDLISQTGYDHYVPASVWNAFLGKYLISLGEQVIINNHCQLQIANCKLLDFKSDEKYDVVYFDAFAVAHQPEMWDEEAIAHTIQFLKPGGVFVTYAITGNLKRMLKSMGMQVQKIPGAPGKREMLRAVR